MKPWTFIPKDDFDLGAAGTHPAEILAWIDTDYMGPLRHRSVKIAKVIVKITYGEQTQELDITPKILGSPYTLGAWQEEIWQDYRNKTEKDFSDFDDSGVGA